MLSFSLLPPIVLFFHFPFHPPKISFFLSFHDETLVELRLTLLPFFSTCTLFFSLFLLPFVHTFSFLTSYSFLSFSLFRYTFYFPLSPLLQYDFVFLFLHSPTSPF